MVRGRQVVIGTDPGEGRGEVCWMIVDGSVMLTKVTKSNRGFDFESKEIEDKLRAYESKLIDDCNHEDDDPELQEQKAWEEYQKDKVARQALKEKRNQ
jgi:hypothetical protein